VTSRRGAVLSRPRGVAAVPVVLLLFFGLGVMLLYANRALIFEQRTAANQARATQGPSMPPACLRPRRPTTFATAC
jgi:hypothetical protein